MNCLKVFNPTVVCTVISNQLLWQLTEQKEFEWHGYCESFNHGIYWNDAWFYSKETRPEFAALVTMMTGF